MSRQTKYDIYDRMMRCAEEGHTYIRATQGQLKALNDQRTHHHQGFDAFQTRPASSENTQHDPPQHAAQPLSE